MAAIFCRYRPFVLRDENNKLTGVLHSTYRERGLSLRWELHKALREHKSGFIFLAQRIIHSIYAKSVPGFSSITDCDYDALLAWKSGKDFTTYGASTIDYEKYFKKKINELAESILISSIKPRILFVTHDWAQHD